MAGPFAYAPFPWLPPPPVSILGSPPRTTWFSHRRNEATRMAQAIVDWERVESLPGCRLQWRKVGHVRRRTELVEIDSARVVAVVVTKWWVPPRRRLDDRRYGHWSVPVGFSMDRRQYRQKVDIRGRREVVRFQKGPSARRSSRSVSSLTRRAASCSGSMADTSSIQLRPKWNPWTVTVTCSPSRHTVVSRTEPCSAPSERTEKSSFGSGGYQGPGGAPSPASRPSSLPDRNSPPKPWA